MFVETLLTTNLRRHFQRHIHLEPGVCVPRPRPPQPGQCDLLYVHVPFCEHLCPFCAFHRVKLNPEKARGYFAALREDIQAWYRQGYRFSDVYVGGGTPTVLPGELGLTLALLRELFPIRHISVETNPNHLREDVLSMLQRHGVDRLSVGVQSFDDALLREMGCYAAYGSGSEIVERVRLAQDRFATLNIDLLFNLPHQDLQSLRRDLRVVVQQLRVGQVSYYPLMSPPEIRRAISKTLGKPTLDREAAFYQAIRDGLRPTYTPASAWCFNRSSAALDEYIVEHQDFVGAGSGSFSYLGGTLYSSTFSINRYLGLVGEGCSPLVAAMPRDRREQYRYALLMGLFGLKLDKQGLRERYGKEIFDSLRLELFVLKRLGAVQEDADYLWLTERGMYYWVALMREFFVAVNGLRDRMRAHVPVEPGAVSCVVDGRKPVSEAAGILAGGRHERADR